MYNKYASRSHITENFRITGPSKICGQSTNLSRRYLAKAQAEFDNTFSIFKRYERANNFCYPPLHSESCNTSLEKKLFNWVKYQRQSLKNFRNGGGSEYDKYKVQKLNSIGFVWEWQVEYRHLAEGHPGSFACTMTHPLQKFF